MKVRGSVAGLLAKFKGWPWRFGDIESTPGLVIAR